MPGTPFGVVHLDVAPVTSGLAIGALVAGIASVLVSLLVICFGVVFKNDGGAWASGAFAVLGRAGRRWRRSSPACSVSGRSAGRPRPPRSGSPAVGLAWPGSAAARRGHCSACLGLGLALLLTLA